MRWVRAVERAIFSRLAAIVRPSPEINWASTRASAEVKSKRSEKTFTRSAGPRRQSTMTRPATGRSLSGSKTLEGGERGTTCTTSDGSPSSSRTMSEPPGAASSIGREPADISDCNFRAILKFEALTQPCSQRSPLFARMRLSAVSLAQTICRFAVTRTKPKPALPMTLPNNSTCVIYSLSRSLAKKARLRGGGDHVHSLDSDENE